MFRTAAEKCGFEALGAIPRGLLTFAFILVAAGFVFPTVASSAEEIKVRHILVRKRAEAEAALDELVNKGVNRNNFIRVCRNHSMDPVTKGSGGDLGWNTRNKFVPEFSEAAFQLSDGEVSEPVRTPYGWHLIFVEQKRDTKAKGPKGNNPTPDKPNLTPTKDPKKDPTVSTPVKKDPHEGHNHGTTTNTQTKTNTNTLVPQETKTEVSTITLPSVPATPNPPVTPNVFIPQSRVSIILEVPRRSIPPKGGIEVSIQISNLGKEDAKVLDPSLWGLGLGLRDQDGNQAVIDTKGATKPANFIVDLPSRSSTGRTVLLHDYFKELKSNRRYWLSWSLENLTKNFNAQFPGEVANLGDAYKAVTGTLSKSRVRVKGVYESFNRVSYPSAREVPLSIYEVASPSKQYYAKMTFKGQTKPVWFALDSKRQLQGVRHFSRLVNDGYYDGLRMFDIRKDNFIRGGCPRNDGTSGPNRRALVSNQSKIPHDKGTLSLATRASARGRSREAGSVFFISLMRQPSWDDQHVPIGKLVEGQEILDQLISRRTMTIDSVSIVSKIDAPQSVAGAQITELVEKAASSQGTTSQSNTQSSTSQETASTAKIIEGRELPQAIIETSKGSMTVELYQDDARNTVANFVNLAENGYYTASPSMKILDRADGYYVRTGSPNNSDKGQPGYSIASETANNTKPHKAGVLTMCLEMDANGKPVPDSAGGQFMICLNDVPYWNGVYTPFGKVISGLDVLKKLQPGDQIKKVTVTQKRQGQYNPATTPRK